MDHEEDGSLCGLESVARHMPMKYRKCSRGSVGVFRTISRFRGLESLRGIVGLGLAGYALLFFSTCLLARLYV